MELSSSLLTMKLYLSPASATILRRERLLRRLEEGLSKPLTLISAPAGFGKTTLLRNWLASKAGEAFPLAWISLDHDDNSPNRFLLYLVAALRTIQPGMGEYFLNALQASLSLQTDSVLTSIINELTEGKASTSSSGSFGLVLDDYQVITAPQVHECLRFLLDHLPTRMHLILITREDPPLPLARLRARDQLVEIRSVDLRFDPSETLAFLNELMKLNLSKAEVDVLETRTEGWIAGLQMAAISLSQRTDKQAFVAEFSGDDRHVMDFLLEEVLQSQTVEVRTFLLKTSILEKLCANLCAAVTGRSDSQEILNYLEQANLFITPLDNRRIWYRFHPLFADFLRHVLRRELGNAVETDLVHRACGWYEREGMVMEEISLAVSGPDFEYAASLLERSIVEIFFQGQTLLVHRWLRAMPERVLRMHPLLCVVYANTQAHTGNFQSQGLEKASYWLQEAEKTLRLDASRPFQTESAGSPIRNITRSFIALTRVYMALWRKEPLQLVSVLARQALASLPPADNPSIDPNYLRFHSGLNFNLGLSLFRMGDEEQAVKAFQNTYHIGISCGDFLNAFWSVYMLSFIFCEHGRLFEAKDFCQDVLNSLVVSGFSNQSITPVVGLVYIMLGQIYLEWNDINSAEEWITKGWELSRFIPGTDNRLQACLAIAKLHKARGNFEAAFQDLDQCENVGSEYKFNLEITRIRLWLAQGKLNPVMKWAHMHPLSAGLTEADKIENLTFIRALIAQHWSNRRNMYKTLPDLGQVMGYLENQLRESEAANRQHLVIELLILRALVAQSMQKHLQANQSLSIALEMAKTCGYVRLFVDEGQPMYHLLKELQNSNQKLRGTIDRLLAAWGEEQSSTTTSSSVGTLIEPLSRRELEVLQLLVDGNTNIEISQKCFISLNTTKKHLTHIFEKLAVNSRKEAVKRAQELKLIHN